MHPQYEAVVLSHLLRQHQLAISVGQPITALPSQFFSFESAWTLVNDRQGTERPPVMASPRPTQYAPRSQAISPCRGSDPDSRGRRLHPHGRGPAARVAAAGTAHKAP